MTEQTNDYLYERIKQSVQEQIAAGLLKPGDRVLSLRRMSRHMRVSISTVMQAYLELERAGILAARPQSGFFVCQSESVPQPRVSVPSPKPVRARRSDVYRSVVALMADREVVPLAAALPDPQLMPGRQLATCMRQALADEPDLMLRYDDVAGLPQLRAQIAYHMLSKGVSVHPDEIVITNGATEAAYQILRAITRPGDLVVVESPAYYGLINLLETLGLYALEIASDPAEGIDLQSFKRALNHYDVRACVLQPNFGNPLGGLYPEDKRREIVKLCSELAVPVIEDDVYGDLSHVGRTPAAISAYDPDGIAIYLSSFSKTIAPGLRVGWIIPGRYREAVLDQRIAVTIANTGPSQMTIANYLAAGKYERHIRKLSKLFCEQTRIYRSNIQKYFPHGTRITDPQGGFLLWVELPESIDTMELYNQSLSQGIVFSPGPLFTAQDRYCSHMRINCGYSWCERVESAVRRLGELAAQR